jgi:hypothetical protein
MRLLALLLLTLAASTSWADPSPRKWSSSKLPIAYRVFAHTSINGVANFQTTALPAVQRGFARWNSSQVSCTRWATSYAGTFSSPSGAAAINGTDGQNRVIWLGGTDWKNGSQTLGVTGLVWIQGSNEIVDADIEMNNDRTWKVGGSGSNLVDVESIIVHESGHFLGLEHSSPTSAIMYAAYPTGAIKVDLTDTDRNDVCTQYPATTSTGAQGDFCQTDPNCQSALRCRGLAGTTGSAICTLECTGDAQCPTGYTCQNSSPSGSTGKACLRPAGAVDLCKFCTSGSDCSTGKCVTNVLQNWCTRSCVTTSDCGSGYNCASTSSGGICVPQTTCPTPQCASNSDCAIGYACQGGMCTATGNPGDRCELSGYCKACSICIGSYQEAYCRRCCNSSGFCQGCTGTTCGTGSQCVQLSGNAAAVCEPSGSGVCQFCDAATPCQGGLFCFGNRCHSTCNPTSPGACTACYATGTGGVCACPDEVAYTGQACGVTSNGLRVCTTGNACVGTPKTCRARCVTPGDNSACPSGQACELVDGAAVCVPANSPGQRCGPCVNTTCQPGLECLNGRCYTPCSPAVPACIACVATSGGAGVCACEDQLASAGESCGYLNGQLRGCTSGSLCVAGICRLECDPGLALCPPGQSCYWGGLAWLCLSQPPPDGGFGTPLPLAQDVIGQAPPGACGCAGAGSGLSVVLAVLGLGAWSRRKRR